MARRSACFLLSRSAFVLASSLESAALGDSLTAHYDEAAVEERSHTVRARLHPGYAELTVQREIWNGGSQPDEAIFQIDLPEGAVAVGLRTRGHGAHPMWFDGKLLDAEIAAAQYLELTGRGQAIPRDPALLYWVNPSSLGLQVFPCPARTSQFVEYTLLVPTRYEAGRHVFDVTPLGTDLLKATWTLEPADARSRLVVAGVEVGAGASIRLAPSEENDAPVPVELVPARAEALEGAFASVDLRSDRSLVHGLWRASARISEVPEGAHVVVLLDTSASVGSATLDRYAAALDGYLTHFRSARVALVAFDRAARAVTNGFRSPSEALEDWARFPHERRNGSSVDAGLAEATRLFRNAPRGERRLLVLTDSLTRSSIEDDVLGRAIEGSTALVHWSSLGPGGSSLAIDPSHRFTVPVEKTGGLVWDANTDGGDADRAAVFEEWARPLRYRVKRVLVGSRVVEAPTEFLDEGAAFEFEETVSGHPTSMTLEAALWGRAVTLSERTNEPSERRLAAFTSAGWDHGLHDFTEAEARHLAFFGRAVTPYTSYLALEPGVRPSTAGIERNDGIGLGGLALAGGGFGRASGIGVGAVRANRDFVENAVREARIACGAEDRALTVELETTRDEIVDLARVDVTPADAGVSRCLDAHLWETVLPAEFRSLQRARFVIAL